MLQGTKLILSNSMSSMPLKLIGDKGRLEQVLVILIRYTLKFSSDKYIKIKPLFNETREELTIEL